MTLNARYFLLMILLMLILVDRANETERACTGQRHPNKPRFQLLGPKFINGIPMPGRVIINEDVAPNPFLTKTELGGPVTNYTVGRSTDHSAGDVTIY